MKSNKVAEIFLDFFKKNNHRVFETKSLIPHNDNSLLWVNAGVVPMKKFFVGEEVPPSKRLVSIQPCIRLNDIENVGRTSSHQTFFEMLGFFSIGDYFKETAITLTLDILKKLFKNLNSVYFTIHNEDKETEKILISKNIPKSRIIKLKSNFWNLGSGPCGPCMEIFIDRGKEFGKDVTIDYIKKDIENERYIEIWNDVFSQFNMDAKTKKITPLKNKNIDSGAGFERIVTILQGKKTVYETDLFSKSIELFELHSSNPSKKHLHIVSDHLRALLFMLSEGVMSGPKNRNYTVKFLIKRLATSIWALDLKQDFSNLIDDALIFFKETLKTRYPFIDKDFLKVKDILKNEVRKEFNELKKYEKFLDELLGTSNKKDLAKRAFAFHDTYGMPLELMIICFERNKQSFPYEEYKKAEQLHRSVSKGEHESNSNFSAAINLKQIEEIGKTKFVGYETLSTESICRKCIKVGQDLYYLFFDNSPFYPEGGGQISDTGQILEKNKKWDVVKCIRVLNKTCHQVQTSNPPQEGKTYTLSVDKQKRVRIQANHSTTHLLHFHLRSILKNDTLQAGAFKSDEKLRLDFFSSTKFNKPELLKELNMRINKDIQRNIKVESKKLTLEKAKKENFLLTFLQDYAKMESLRGVIINGSKELCIGTHVKETKEIETFYIKNFKSKGTNTYRIEAVTMDAAKKEIEKAKKVEKKTKKADIKFAFQESDLQLIKNKNEKIALGVFKENYKRQDINEFKDKIEKSFDVIIFVTDKVKPTILLFGKKGKEVLFERIIKNFSNDMIAGGGSGIRYNGVLLKSIKELEERLKDI